VVLGPTGSSKDTYQLVQSKEFLSNSTRPAPESLWSSTINLNEKLNVHGFSYNLLFLNHFNILNHWIKHYFFSFSNYLYRFIDKGMLDLLCPFGLSKAVHFIAFKIELLAIGNINSYAIIIIISSL